MNQSLLVLSGMLENVTLGQVLICITFLSGVFAAIAKIKSAVKSMKGLLTDWAKEELTPEFKAINDRLDQLEQRDERQDLENVKNYLVLFMSDLERNKPDEVELLRFEEQYNYYVKKGGNSYIHRKYEKLKAEGKL